MEKEIVYIEGKHIEKLKIKVAAYVRVSSDSEDQMNSLETQQCYYESLLAKDDNVELVDVYCDSGISGMTTDKREDFNRMMEDARRGKIHKIITKSISRFARNTSDTLTYVRELKELGVSVIFEKENIDTGNTTGEVLLTVFGAFAQEESMTISGNLKQANRIRMEKGEYVSSSVPLGYKLVDNKLEVNKEFAPIVKRIFREYLSGNGAVKIAENLTNDCIQTVRGNSKWSHRAVMRVLKNERYKGDMLLQKNYTAEVFPLVKRENKGEQAKFYVRNSHESIVSAEDFDRVQEILKNRMPVNSGGADNVLKGKVFCGDCGTLFRKVTVNGKLYRVCRKHNLDGSCGVKAVREQEIYDLFVSMYNKLKENYSYSLEPMLKDLVKLGDKKYGNHKGLAEVNSELSVLSTQCHTLNGLMNSGVLDVALFESEKDGLTQRIRKLKEEKKMLLEDDKDQGIESTENLIEFLQGEEQYLLEFDAEVFENVVDKIKIYEDRRVGFVLMNGVELTELANGNRR